MNTDGPENDDARSPRNVWLVPCMATRRDLFGGGTLWLDAAPPVTSGAGDVSIASPPPATLSTSLE